MVKAKYKINNLYLAIVNVLSLSNYLIRLKVISSFHIGLEILPTQLVALVALSFGAIVS